MLTCLPVCCREAKLVLMNEHIRCRHAIAGMLQSAFNTWNSHLQSSAVKKTFTYKHFSFEVLCMYEDAVLQNAVLSYSADGKARQLEFVLSVDDLEQDWCVA